MGENEVFYISYLRVCTSLPLGHNVKEEIEEKKNYFFKRCFFLSCISVS